MLVKDGSEISRTTKLSLGSCLNSVQAQLKLSLNSPLQGSPAYHSNVFWAIIIIIRLSLNQVAAQIKLSLNQANLGLSPSLSRFECDIVLPNDTLYPNQV